MYLIEEWGTYEYVDSIFIIGNIALPLEDLTKDLSSCNFMKFLQTLKLMYQEKKYENSLLCKCKFYIYNQTLLIQSNFSLENYEYFFKTVALDILITFHESKTNLTLFSNSESVTKDLDLKSKVMPIKIAERPRHSLFRMVSVSEALECVLKESESLETTSKRFNDSLSFILAENVVATEPYPAFNASVKDGYAVLANDESTIRFVIGVVTPGCQLDFDMKPGTCVRVSTGSAIPTKADAVIQVEDTLVASVLFDRVIADIIGLSF